MSRANIKAVAGTCTLGEGPHWDEERQELLYVDQIGDFSFRRYKPSTGEDFKMSLDRECSLIVPIEGQANNYLVSTGRSLRQLEWDGLSRDAVTPVTSIREIVTVDDDTPENRFNDGKCDSLGRLWAGTMYAGMDLDNWVLENGYLYQLGLDGQIARHLSKVSLSNGMAWTSDNTKFFHIDSLAYQIRAFDYDLSTGALSNQQVLLDLKKSGIAGFPDGMTIDASNNLWLATFGEGKVLRIDSTTAKVVDEINFAGHTKSITSVAFGGPNLDTLYVTSGTYGVSEEQRSSQPNAGALFEVTNLGVKGKSGGISYKGKLA